MSARRKSKNPWILFSLGAVSILFPVFLSVLLVHPPMPSRIGIAIVGEPAIVFSYDPVRRTMTAVRIPPDVSVDVTRGYGVYPISSVWKLDTMDKRRGILYTETMEEAIGIPVRFFIDPGSRRAESEGLEVQIRNALSIRSCIRTFIDKKLSNIPPGLLFEISRAIYGMNPTDITFFDLTNEAVFISETLPDGTSVKKIDAGKLTLLMGTHAEDAEIRKENLRVSVFNTTNTPGLAQKLTRVLEGAGIHVSSIANNETIRPVQCILRAKREIHKTNTVKILLWLYGCSIEEDMNDSQSDVTFLVGTDFEKRFLSF
jgi:hypothetical protein